MGTDAVHDAPRETELATRILELLVLESGDALYDKALEQLLTVFDSEYGVFGYVDMNGDLVCPTMSRVFHECEMGEECLLYKQHAWTGLWGRALRTGAGYFTNEPPPVPAGHMPIRNNLAVPIMHEGRAIGLINIANNPRGYTKSDKQLLERVAARIAPTLKAWSLRELREQEHLQAARTLERIVDITVEERNQLEALLASLQEAVLILNGEGELVDVNEAAARLHGFTSRDEMVSTYEETAVEKRHVSGGTLASGDRPLTRARAGETFSDQEYAVCVPDTGARFIGSYGASHVTGPEGARIASVVTIHDVTDMRERMKLDQALDGLGLVLQSSLDSNEILADVVVLSREALEAESCALVLRDDGHWRVPFQCGLEIVEGARFSDEELPMALEAERGGRVVQDCGERAAGLLFGAENKGGCLLGIQAPLVVQGRFLGTLAFHRRAPRWFSEAEIEFARRLAGSVSLSLKNAELYRSQRRVAQTLQEALLRAPEQIRGIDFGLLYRSASEASLVGGDFYDIFRIGDTHVGMVLGDVAGKGLDAAVLTSLIKNTVRALASDVVSPREVIEKTSAILYANTLPEAFATVMFGILDLRTGRFRYTNAGHTVGLLARHSGEVASLPPNGTLAGAFPDARYTTSEAHLEEGDLVLLYTDGITEARQGRELFGEARLVELVHGLASAEPQTCAEQVLSAAQAFAGGRLHDDVAVLAVRLTGRVDAPAGEQQSLF